MGACISSGKQTGATATGDAANKAATSSKDAKDTVKITVEKFDDAPKETVKESDAVKQRDDEVAEKTLRKDDAVTSGSPSDDKETNEPADATSEPIVTAPESTDEASTEASGEVTATPSQAETDEGKVSEKEEPTECAAKEPQTELLLPGGVESEPKQVQATDNTTEQEESVKSVSPDEIRVCAPSAGEKGETHTESDAQEVKESAEEATQLCVENEGSADAEQATTESEGGVVVVEGDVVACPSVEATKQADSIAKNFIAPLEDIVIASVVDK